MIGPEVVGAASAAGKGIEKVLTSSQQEHALMLELARDTPQALLAAEEYSQRLLIKQAVITKLYERLGRLVGISQEYFSHKFAEDLAKKTNNIPEEYIVAPSPAVAVPAMQALGYSLDEPDLKEMYLTLLATASDSRRNGEAHPAFAEVVRQLTAAEAAALPGVMNWQNFPLAEVRKGPPLQYSRVRTNLTPLVSFPQRERVRASLTGVWFDNWSRLGLGIISYDSEISNKTIYEWCEEHPDFVEVAAAHESGSVSIKRGRFVISDFGHSFAHSLSIDNGPDPSRAENGGVLIAVVGPLNPPTVSGDESSP